MITFLSETPVDFRDGDGEHWGAWSWDEVEWFCKCRDLDLPYNEGTPNAV